MFLSSLLLVGCLSCLLNLFLVSSRFLHTLLVLEQFNAFLLILMLVESSGDFVYFVSFVVLFTLEAVVSLVVITRLWSGGGLLGVSLW